MGADGPRAADIHAIGPAGTRRLLRDHRWPCGCRGPAVLTSDLRVPVDYGEYIAECPDMWGVTVSGSAVVGGRDAAGAWTRCEAHGRLRLRRFHACGECDACEDADGNQCAAVVAPRYSVARHREYPAAARRVAAAALAALGRRAERATAYCFWPPRARAWV